MKSFSSGRFVLVSGAPGAGKSTIAAPLAEALGFPLISKDYIKESLFDSLDGIPDNMEYSRKIGSAAMELLWTIAARCPAAVLDANFRPRSDYERSRIEGLGGRIVEVFCQCSPDEAARRFALRAKMADHHPAHMFSQLSPKLLKEYDRPVGIGDVIELDTSRSANIAELKGRLLEIWNEK